MADYCTGTLPGEVNMVDGFGCAPSQRDGDYDGVMEDADACPTTPEAEVFDIDNNPSSATYGCSESERDTDGDGAIDSVDEFPSDPTQTVDTDSDGFGNNPDGTNGDDCPNEAGTSTGNLRGCVDGDDDGWADVEDIVPNIGTQWNDTDGDGYYDNYANINWMSDALRVNQSWPGQLVPGARDPDRCPLHANEFANSQGNPGCPEDMDPTGGDLESNTTTPFITPDSSGGMDTTVVILIAALVILFIAVGGAVSISIRKPKKKTKQRSIVKSSDESVMEPESDQDEELSPEDDPNYKVDENGCEWWYDEGAWWYRTPEMEDWTEYDS